MDNLAELMQLCRLCLVKDQVNVPIFEEQGDIRQIFLKITACLPIKVSKDDSLPKKICDGCLYKLELLYQFWNTTANAEKQLLAWLSQAGMEADSKTTQEAVAIALQTQVTTHSVKEEEIDPPESIPESTDDMTTEAESFIMQPPQLPFEPAGAQFEEPSGFNESQEESHASDDNGAQNDDSQDVDDTEPPPPKRSRRQAAIKAAQLVAQKNDDDDEDEDEEEEDDDEEDVDDPSIEATIPKTEEESEDEDMEDSGTNPEPTDFVSLGTADEEQPGPSGVGKVDTSEAPSFEPLVTITEVEKTKVKWNRKLPEIEIIPVDRDGTLMIKDEDRSERKSRKQHAIEITKRTKQAIAASKYNKKKPSTGYVNPFNYENLTIKNFHRKNRHFDNSNLKWACMICSEVAVDKEGLIEHYEEHKRERDERIKSEPADDDSEYFNCAICGQEFTSLKGYEKHFDKKHGERKYSCIECSKVYKDALQLCIHNYTVHASEDKKYKCISCEYTTFVRKKLKEHLDEHEASFQFKCEVCNKGFELEGDFDEHKIVHGVTSPFSCDVCGKTFPYTKYLLVHKKTAHPEIFGSNPAANECQLCNKRFAHKKSLILHIRGHTGENSVLCDMCGKRLSSSEHLKQHLRIHTGFKPHKCSVCGKGFAKKCNLTLHERVHSGEKPYVCRVCSKAFSQRSTVVIHERYHTGERPYVCTLCNKGFVAKGLLSVHIKTCTVIPAEYL